MRTSFLLAMLLAAPSAGAVGPELSPAARQQLDEGLTRLYALDYASSRAAFRKLIELEPDNPFGYLFESGGIWWQSSQEYGLFKDTPTLQGLFEQDIEAALRKADAYIDSKDPKSRADGYFVSGMSLGTRGQWNLMKGKWFDAYFDGKKAVKHLKKCVKQDEEYYDAYLGLGVFDYQAAHLSGIAKLGALFGLRGDEPRGLERISLAMEKAGFAGRQAAQFLSSIYIIDKRDFASALPVVERLRRDFPDSPYFAYLHLLSLRRVGQDDASIAVGREIADMIAADPARFRSKWLTLVCGLAGEKCLAGDDLEEAIAWLDLALNAASGDKKPGPFKPIVHLLRGHAHDALGRRAEALADYKRADAPGAPTPLRHDAQRWQSVPCGREALLKLLRSMTKEETISPIGG